MKTLDLRRQFMAKQRKTGAVDYPVMALEAATRVMRFISRPVMAVPTVFQPGQGSLGIEPGRAPRVLVGSHLALTHSARVAPDWGQTVQNAMTQDVTPDCRATALAARGSSSAAS
jgi:hypothetical protein